MSIIEDMKEQRAKDKEETLKAFDNLKEYARESFDKKNREKELEIQKARLTSPEMKEFTKNQYTTHMKLILAGILFLMFGFIFAPLFIIALGCMVSGLVCMLMNWNRINSEHKQRKNIK